MNKITAMMLLLYVAASAFAADCKPLTQEERAQLMLQYTGGAITNPAVGNIVIVNTQVEWDHEKITKAAIEFLNEYRLKFEVIKGKPVPVEAMTDAVARWGAKAGVFVVDSPCLPGVLASPDSALGIINVRACERNGMDAAKALRQALILALGGVYAPSGRASDFQPELVFGMIAHLPKLGIIPWKEATYRNACREGWAPPPSNDLQRKIWDEIHAAPTKPIKITYDKENQKPVVK